MSEHRQKVFVYGTLKRRQPASLERFAGKRWSSFVAEGFTVDNDFVMRYSSGRTGFPFVYKQQFKEDTQTGHVFGEIWEVTPGVLEKLDKYEGVPLLYKREEVKVVNMDTGRENKVFMYISANPYVSGDFCPLLNVPYTNNNYKMWVF